jgi:adenylate cyclase
MKALLSRVLKPSPLVLSLAVTGLILLLYLLRVPFLDFVEMRTYDLRFLYRGALPTQGKVALAVVDEKSLAELGRWQSWPRSRMAKLVDALDAAGVSVIGFDVGFFEPETAEARKNDDALLAQSIARAKAKVVMGYYFQMDKQGRETTGTPEQEAAALGSSLYQMVKRKGPMEGKPPVLPGGLPTFNLPILNAAATATGYFNTLPDEDGTIRSVPLVLERGGDYVAPLSLRVLSLYADMPLILNLEPHGVDSVQIGGVRVPTDDAGRLLINYRGGVKTFPHYSVCDILAGRLPVGALSGKMVIIGATAAGTYDIRITPVSQVFPGIEVHANIIDNLLAGDYLGRLNWGVLWDLLAILALGLAVGLLVPRLGALMGAGGAAALLAGYLAGGQMLFNHARVVISLVYPILNLVICYTTVTVYHYMVEEREKKKVAGAFAYYLSPAVINEMLKSPEKLRLGGDKKDLTVLFSDIRGFTSFSEHMAPEALVAFLNDYLTRMTDVVFNYDGLLDKYIGDAIMAVFGAPLPQPDHAARACGCALDMIDVLAADQEKWRSLGPASVNIGIGVNTGPMVVGNLGSARRFDYTVVGDAVNLGSRLEGTNKIYGTHIIISESTYALVKDQFLCRELDLVRVKGKTQPISLYELVSRAPGSPEEVAFIQLFHEAARHYRAQEWDSAEALFSKAAGMRPNDRPTLLYLERIGALRACPPDAAAWDGCFTMTSK